MTAEDDETVLVLRHFDMPATHARDHGTGWTSFVGERLATAANGV